IVLKRFTSPLWIGLSLVLALLFVVASVWLIATVGRQQKEIRSHFEYVSTLQSVVQSLNELEAVFSSSLQGRRVRRPDPDWTAALQTCRTSVAALQEVGKKITGPAPLASELESLLARLDRHRSLLAQDPLDAREQQKLEAAWRATWRQAVQE